ncbi:unnamed protein product [Adineta steineri]|uniref:Uncharacterized protein n=1 Tax=Adineta steineri TaxID=433720 RepID=A0A819KGP9_9BILA|nr:unnamed protein product [Adineta steineri]
MASRKKKFEACLVRIREEELIVVGWDQIVTTTDKSKLTVGSCVGYKQTTNRRQKVIRGKILVTGSFSICEQQLKLLMQKINKKKSQHIELNNNEEEEEEKSVDAQDVQEDSDTNDEQSAESEDEHLHIVTEKDTRIIDDNDSEVVQIHKPKDTHKGNKYETRKLCEISSNDGQDKDEQTTTSSSSKRTASEVDVDVEDSASKRLKISYTRFHEMQNENRRLHAQVDKYKKEWMPRPTDPAVIEYFKHMGKIFSYDPEYEEEKEDILINVYTRLDMNEEQLNRLKQKNGTKTARAIVRALYPVSVRMDVSSDDIPPEFRQAIHVEECEQLNKALSQSQNTLDNLDQHSHSAATFDDQSQINFDNRSSSSYTPQAADETNVFEDKEDASTATQDSFTRPVAKVDLAAALVALKNRHSLSAVCVNDICSLLCILNVPNAPRSWFHVQKSFDSAFVSSLDRKVSWICPECKRSSDDTFKCSNINCSWRFAPPAPMPPYFYTFNIIDQLFTILATSCDLNLPTKTNDTSRTMLTMSDIVDGSYYNKILAKESYDILTLTMNTDGVQPFNCSEKSIWPVTFIINEITRKKRYCFQNLVLGGIWPGPTKPKRFEMAAFLETIVEQLKILEKGYQFECRSGSGFVTRFLKIFLICACMDKPAQAITQNLPEATAKYGCGRCEIRGYSVPSSRDSHHHINCFPIDCSLHQPHLRSNERYDYLLCIKEKNDAEVEKLTSRLLDRAAKRRLKKQLISNKESECGILGRCILRQLKYFDVGFSFLSDNLHNIYHGVFVSMVAIHFAEYRDLTIDMVKSVKSLLHEFLIKYPKLYTARHNQQVIHSLNHIGQTIEDYGPLTSYSTFHFESILGMLMRTIKGTRREEIEVIGNLNMFRNACLHLHDTTIDRQLKTYIENMVSGRGYDNSQSNVVRVMHSSSAIQRISTVFSNQHLHFFTSCKVGHIRYTTNHYSKTKAADDSAVMFQVGNELYFGLITAIFTTEDNETLLELWPVNNSRSLNITTNGQVINVPTIQEGTLENDDNFYYISIHDIIEKCVYWRKQSNKVFFFRYPNLEKSS